MPEGSLRNPRARVQPNPCARCAIFRRYDERNALDVRPIQPPARRIPLVRENRVSADFCRWLRVENFHLAALHVGRVIERDRLQRIVRRRPLHPVLEPREIARVHNRDERNQDARNPSEKFSRRYHLVSLEKSACGKFRKGPLTPLALPDGRTTRARPDPAALTTSTDKFPLPACRKTGASAAA